MSHFPSQFDALNDMDEICNGHKMMEPVAPIDELADDNCYDVTENPRLIQEEQLARGQLDQAVRAYSRLRQRPLCEAYTCSQPTWSQQGARAMNNIYMSKEVTQAVLHYVDEPFENASKLYYYLDYTVAQQIIDGQTLRFEFADASKRSITLVPTELHRDGRELYAVVVANNHESKQTHKVIEHQRISEALMTPIELFQRYGIRESSLPVGSRRHHGDYECELARIEVTRQLIESTNFLQTKITQRRTKGSNREGRRGGRQASRRGYHRSSTLDLTAARFRELVLAALGEFAGELVAMAQVRFRDYEYHVEKLLPVWIPEREQLVAVAFRHNGLATQVSGIYLDLTDMKNKANLVAMVPAHSWLNRTEAPHRAIHCLRLHPSSPSHSPSASPSPSPSRSPSTSPFARRQNHSQYRPSLQQRHSAPMPSSEEMPVARPIMSGQSRSMSPPPTSPLMCASPVMAPLSPELASLSGQLDRIMAEAQQQARFFEQVRVQHATYARSQSVPPPVITPVMAPILLTPPVVPLKQSYVYPIM